MRPARWSPGAASRSTEGLGISPDLLGARAFFPPGDWDFLATIPARGETSYHYVAPTLCDSTSEGICWSTFLVSAQTEDPLTYFDSSPDSGYSVDNLEPAPPGSLLARSRRFTVVITWEPNQEPDLDHYAVYRGENFCNFSIASDLKSLFTLVYCLPDIRQFNPCEFSNEFLSKVIQAHSHTPAIFRFGPCMAFVVIEIFGHFKTAFLAVGMHW